MITIPSVMHVYLAQYIAFVQTTYPEIDAQACEWAQRATKIYQRQMEGPDALHKPLHTSLHTTSRNVPECPAASLKKQ